MAALGGVVWIARPSPDGADLFEVGESGPATPVEFSPPRADDVPINGFSAAIGLEAGWFGSQDFYLQDPSRTEPTFKTVNAMQAALVGSFDLDVGVVRVGLGADVPITIGAAHVALYGDEELASVAAATVITDLLSAEPCESESVLTDAA